MLAVARPDRRGRRRAGRRQERAAAPQGRSARGPRQRAALTATLLLEQGVELAIIKELLGHAHIGVTAGVYAHVRLRLQRQAIDALSNALGGQHDDPDDPPATAAVR